MTQQERGLIVRLSNESFNAQLRLDSLAARNAAGLSVDEARKQAADYAVAQAVVYSAKAELEKAIKKGGAS